MNQDVRLKLIEVAKAKKQITYQELSDSCKLKLDMQDPSSGPEIGKMLDEITEFENSEKRPLLSVVAIRGKEKTPGQGFYTLCEKLGFGKATKLQNDPIFFSNQTTLCTDFWKDEANYSKFK
jgi:hypothetical protein